MRSVEVLKIQNAARNSHANGSRTSSATRTCGRSSSPTLLTRSQRICHENLRLRDKDYVEAYEDWIAQRAGVQRTAAAPVPPMFTPFTLRGVDAEEPRRRLADGAVLVRRRLAGRLSPRAPRRARHGRRGPGLHRDDLRLAPTRASRRAARACGTTRSATAWKRIVDFVHARQRREDRLQLGHAGAKGSTQLRLGRRWTSRSPTATGR